MSEALKVKTYDNHYTEAKKCILALEKDFIKKFDVNKDLSRAIVSYQSNKTEPIFRWFKYREGFSKSLVEYCLDKIDAKKGHTVLDPFAGTGATAFTSAQNGYESFAIELLPVGAYFMKTRQLLNNTASDDIIKYCKDVSKNTPWHRVKSEPYENILAITKGAYPQETAQSMGMYLKWLDDLSEHNKQKAELLRFVLYSVLEEISYTRKDGQYLRWDARSPRTRSKFNKGRILSFDEAISKKLNDIIFDLSETNADLFEEEFIEEAPIKILQGTVFEKIQDIEEASVDIVITSPPYCNRYDYTRTYALELEFLGVDESKIRELRQSMLSCTVENKPKKFDCLDEYLYQKAFSAFGNCVALNSILTFLEEENRRGELNNKGIISMIRGYFLELAVHLAQVSEKMKKGGKYVMVNDNVQYNGLPIPVDCILSYLAERLGFECKKIWVLPKGKGNSSQQMAKHGRSEIRKCVIVWEKC